MSTKRSRTAPPTSDTDPIEKVYAAITKHPGSIAAAIDDAARVTPSQGTRARTKLLDAGRIYSVLDGRAKTWHPAAGTSSATAVPAAPINGRGPRTAETPPTVAGLTIPARGVPLGKGELLALAVAVLKDRAVALTPGEIGRILGRDPHAISNALDAHGHEQRCPQVGDTPKKFQYQPPATTRATGTNGKTGGTGRSSAEHRERPRPTRGAAAPTKTTASRTTTPATTPPTAARRPKATKPATTTTPAARRTTSRRK